MSGISPAEKILIGLGIRSPADLDLDAIAWSLGAAVRYRPLDGCEAMIVGAQSKAVILVNDRGRVERQRFSIAHEIGHWHYHRGQVLFCGATDIANPANGPLSPERQADDFASDLVLPAYMITPFLQKMRRITLNDVRDIAGQFKTSLTATLVRMIKSNRFPVVLVCHGVNGKKWSWPSSMIAGWWRSRSDLDRDSFAYDLLFGAADENDRPRKIGADAWFDFNGSDRHEVHEQSFRVSKNEILTVLTVPEDGLV